MESATALTIDSAFRNAARTIPEREAVRGTASCSSYADLQALIESVCAALIGLGIGDSPRLLISFRTNTLALATIIGAVKAGFTPYLIEPHLTWKRIAEYREVSRSNIVVSEGDAPTDQQSMAQVLVDVYSGSGESYRQRLLLDVSKAAPAPIEESITKQKSQSPEGIGLFTSGTMGERKLAFRTWDSFTLSPNVLPSSHLVIIALPIHHIAALGNTFQALTLGHTVGIVNGLNPHSIGRLIRPAVDTEVELIMTPTQAAGLLQVSDRYAGSHESVSSIQLTGARAGKQLCSKLKQLFPNASIFCGYGISELPVRIGLVPSGEAPPLGSIGKPYPDANLALVDDDGNPSSMGELWIATNRTDDAGTERHWYKTGDILRIDTEGWYYYVDRKDNMLNIAGENVYPAEIEEALASHPDIVTACAVPLLLDDHSDPIPGALVVKRNSCALSTEAIYKHLSDVAAAAAIPRVIAFADKLPMLSSGKVNRTAVQSMLLRIAQQRGKDRNPGEVDRLLTGIWKEVLKVNAVNVDDDFFDLGGDSLQLVLLISRIGNELGISLDISEIASHSSFVRMRNYLIAYKTPASGLVW